MTKSVQILVSCLVLVSLAACGKDQSVSGMSSDLSSSGRSAGSCMLRGDRISICVEYIQSGSVTNAGVDAARNGCVSSTSEVIASFSSSGCDISSAFGFCSSSRVLRQDGEVILFNEVAVFRAPTTESYARALCNRVSGRYSTTAPQY